MSRQFKILSIILFLSTQFFFIGCMGTASLGSNGEVSDYNRLEKLTYVEIISVTTEGIDDYSNSIANPDSVKLLFMKEINSRGLLTFLPSTDDSGSSDIRSKFVENGGVLSLKMKYFYPELDGINAEFSVVATDLYFENVIFYSSHNTYTGNSYFLPPGIKVITEDAVKGCVNKLETLIRKNNNN